MNTALKETQYHNPVTIDLEKTMTTVDFSKLTGERHDQVLRKVRLMAEISLCGFAERDYKDDRGKTQPMYEMTFAASISLANSYQSGKYFHLIMSGFENVLQEIHAKTKPQLKLENKVSELESKLENTTEALKTSQDAMAKAIANPEAGMAMQKHDLLMEWVNMGWLEHSFMMKPRHKYKITKRGAPYLFKPARSKSIRLR